MSASDLPTESELIVKGRKAAYCARRRLGEASDLLTGQDMGDLIQAATLAYWKHHQNGRPIPFCFVCAQQAAEKYFYRCQKFVRRDTPFAKSSTSIPCFAPRAKNVHLAVLTVDGVHAIMGPTGAPC
jgi:hypothetical protein